MACGCQAILLNEDVKPFRLTMGLSSTTCNGNIFTTFDVSMILCSEWDGKTDGSDPLYSMLQRGHHHNASVSQSVSPHLSLTPGKYCYLIMLYRLKCLVWSVALYTAETWTLTQTDRRLESFEMWISLSLSFSLSLSLSLSLRFNGHYPGEPRLAGVY